MEENKTSIGSIIATIIIIALIILGGLYFWGKRIEESKNVTNQLNGQGVTEAPADPLLMEANAIKNLSQGDELEAIETDLQNTKTTDLSPELDVQLPQ
jgi:hypothetical protein